MSLNSLAERFSYPPSRGLDVAAAVRAGQYVILTADRSVITREAQIFLPRLDRQAAADVLQAAGLDFHNAQRMAALGRTSLPALVRQLSRDPRVVQPDWLRPPDVSVLAPLVLLGSWTTEPGDIEAVEGLANQPWEQIERRLNALERSSDPPLRRVGNRWRYSSVEEAFLLLRPHLTTNDLNKWLQMATNVLLEPDPVMALSQEEQYMASIQGIRREWSDTLRQGIAQAATLMGACESDAAPGGDASLVAIAELLVEDTLRQSNEDADGILWQQLADVLPLLAEAAPNKFLDAVEDDLSQTTPVLRAMFHEGTSIGFGRFSPHTGLLWALERVCWSDEISSREHAHSLNLRRSILAPIHRTATDQSKVWPRFSADGLGTPQPTSHDASRRWMSSAKSPPRSAGHSL